MHSPQMFAQTRCVMLERDVDVTGVAGLLWRRRFSLPRDSNSHADVFISE